jgi:uncharacterized protein YggT (Ycf19 family)
MLYFSFSLLAQNQDLYMWTTSTGCEVALPDGPIFEFATALMAESAAWWIQLLITYIRALQFFIYLRYTMQFFIHISPYDGGVIETLYNLPMWFINTFRGVLPNIGGIDLGLMLGPWLLERLETVLGQLIIIDPDGIQY